MKKSIFKFFIIFLIFIMSMGCISLATNINEIMPISTTSNLQNQQINTNSKILSDLFVSEDNEYNLTNSVEGNVFASSEVLNIGSSSQEVIISGNLFVTADTINIKSNVVYSESKKDSSGNALIQQISNKSAVSGNVFIIANKFVLEPGCEILGDLYVCADSIELAQNSTINGNVFAISNSFILDSKINGDLYVSSKNFTMKYYGFIYRDLHLSSQNSLLEGLVHRNSFITSDSIITSSTFINEGNFNIENSSNLLFSGEITGNANINSKKIIFKNTDDNSQPTICKIVGNLNYSSSEELDISESIVNGNISYTKYINNSNKLLSILFNFIVKLLSSLIYITIIYLVINKLNSNFINNLPNIKLSNILISLAIGFGIFILIPIISILLLLTNLGSLLGFSLILLYAFILILAKAIFVIYVSTIINKKIAFNKYIILILVVAILSVIELIPYVGFCLTILSKLIGLGLLFKQLFLKKK